VAAPSACEIHREWIESQVLLGRNAMSIYQDLSEKFGFTHRYNSVKRFVAALKAANQNASTCSTQCPEKRPRSILVRAH